MPVSPARAAAFDILLQVEQQDAYASELLHSARYANLSVGDHGLATELVMGVLRWRSWLDQRIAGQSSQPLAKLDAQVLNALRIAVYQMVFLDRVPERAAVHESVELVKRARKRSAAPFVNAVLRKLKESKRDPGNLIAIDAAGTASELSEASAHPLWLVERWAGEFGFDAARHICRYGQQAPVTAVRVDQATEEELKRAGIELDPGQLLMSARRVRAVNVTGTAAFREGRVLIQDEASQLVAMLVGKGSKILDCCAAPGGKARLVAEQNPDATVLAVDLHPHRARLLRRLVPAENVQVIAADVRQLAVTVQFDRILADVPCSGTGTLARNPEIKWRLKPEDLADLQARQLEILSSALRNLAPGGRLIYSTCSLEREENQEVVEKALAAGSSLRVLDCHAELERLNKNGALAWKDLKALTRGPYLRTIPGVHPWDGFFVAILEKN